MDPYPQDLRVSRVAPAVEDNLTQLVDMVKQIGRKGDITESQNRRMVGYLGNLDDMRSQIVIMVQRYESDDKVLKRLLNLVDRIDDVKTLASFNAGGAEEEVSSPASTTDSEIARQYDTPFNPLMVSTFNLLDVSGIFADDISPEEFAEEDEDEGDEYWDHPDDLADLEKAVEDIPDVSSINLSVSNIALPSIVPLSHSRFSNHFITQPESSSSSNGKNKGKGVRVSIEQTSIKSKSKGKGKARAESDDSASDYSEEESSASRSSRESGSDSGSASETDTGTPSSSSGDEGASAIRRSQRRTNRKLRKVEKQAPGWIRASPFGGGIPVPPPMPPPSRRKKHVQVGPCDPVLCKICYDEYNRLEQLFTIKECGHTYCRDCLGDYLTTNINEGAVLDLVCPFPDCETEISPHAIKTLCVPETFARYEKFIVIASLRMDPNARWCPNPYCNNGIKADPDNPWVFCNACKFEFCFTCLGERHDGAACGKEALAYLEKKRKSEADAFEQFNLWTDEHKSGVKACPTCKAFIEKNDGCNHMTCGNPTCKTQFCWLCLNVYFPDHFSNNDEFPGCFEKQYWTPPLPNPNFTVQLDNNRSRGRFGRIAKKVGIYVGVGVAVVTLGVPAAVIGGPVYGCFKLHKRLKRQRQQQRVINTLY